MAQKNTGQPYNPKYLHEFTKSIAGEVKVLLNEVGKLREERQKLTMEVSQLMELKAKCYEGLPPEWMPKPEVPMVEAPPPPPPAIEAPAARPGWRVVHKREKRPKKIAGPPPSAPTPAPPPEPVQPHMPAWAQWRPNPLLAPTPVIAPVAAPPTPPQRSGLFGPATPPPK